LATIQWWLVIGNFRFRYRFRPKYRFRYAFWFRFWYHSIFWFQPKFRFKIEQKTKICLHAIIPNWLEKHIFFFNLEQMKFFLIKHFLIKSDVGLSLNIKAHNFFLCVLCFNNYKKVSCFSNKKFYWKGISVSVSVCSVFRFRFRYRFRLNRNFGISVSV